MAGLQDFMLYKSVEEQNQTKNPLFALADGVARGIEEGRQKMREDRQAEEDFALQMKFDNQAATASNKIGDSIPTTIPKRTISRNEKGQRKTSWTMVKNPQLDVIDQERRKQESDERIKLIQQQTDLTGQQIEKLKTESEQLNIAKENESRFVKDSAKEMLESIKVAKDGINNFGLAGPIPAVWGSKKVDWQNNVDKILSSKVVDKLLEMKRSSKTGASGFGQLSEKELLILKQSSTALSKKLSPKDALKYLNAMQSVYEKALQPTTVGRFKVEVE